METRGDKKRASYFSETELEVLMTAYEEYKPVLTKKSNTAASAKERISAWQQITDRVNACNTPGTRRTLSQVKMKHKNILQQANRKKAEALRAGGGPLSLPPAEELDLPLKGEPAIDGTPGGSSSDSATNTMALVKCIDADGQFVLMEPPASLHSVKVDEDEEEAAFAVRELDSSRPMEVHDAPIAILQNIAGAGSADEGRCPSTMNLGSLPTTELHKVHLLRQIKKCDLEMDLIQLNAKKTSLEIELLERQLKQTKK
ncbi:uncharacterized protein LOC101158414 isoform X2 [Oryzias latipes]|uniref:uncharacterized protein LOC101158414 isoform X2 n=1 Tax=Oryzias latipes TaxID=8090 RepID=UPI0005CC289F|nr:uncharacterized protein LOC101158414 isoform X2 [Oryzias latipes]